jgi:ribosomal protein L3 glutamine methyltransferase
LTLAQLIAKTEKQFKSARLHYGHGTENARDEAAFLVLRALRLPFSTDLTRPVNVRSATRIESLVRKRIHERVPVAYLLREAWLDGQCFYVDERVIVPRSHIAFLLKNLPPPRSVLDLCTGSGCLAVLAARAFPKARVTASDISVDALSVARRNVGRRKIRLVQSDLFDKVRGTFDLVVSNPPYVPTRSMQRLPGEYRWEPALALGAGHDGLDLVRRILAQARPYLSAKGRLICEVGEARGALEKAFPRLPFTWLGDSVFGLERSQLSKEFGVSDGN